MTTDDTQPKSSDVEFDLASRTTSVRIYGVEIGKVHDPELGPILEDLPDYPFVGFFYYGYRVLDEDVRFPTDRCWYVRKDAIEAAGVADDFTVDEQAVSYFDLNIAAEIYEKTYRRAQVGAEVLGRQRVFASRMAEAPSPAGASTEQIVALSNALAGQVAAGVAPNPSTIHMQFSVGDDWGIAAIGGGGGGGGGGWGGGGVIECNNLCKSYKSTRYDPHTISDSAGSDCD